MKGGDRGQSSGRIVQQGRDGDGVSEAQGDCDDTSPWSSPNIDEVCEDSRDNNCDGTIDEECGDDGVVTPDGDGGSGCQSSIATASTARLAVLGLFLLALVFRRCVTRS